MTKRVTNQAILDEIAPELLLVKTCHFSNSKEQLLGKPPVTILHDMVDHIRGFSKIKRFLSILFLVNNLKKYMSLLHTVPHLSYFILYRISPILKILEMPWIPSLDLLMWVNTGLASFNNWLSWAGWNFNVGFPSSENFRCQARRAKGIPSFEEWFKDVPLLPITLVKSIFC